MAQIVYVEPGDVLVFANTGLWSLPPGHAIPKMLEELSAHLGIARTIIFEGPAEVSVVRPDSKVDEVDMTQLGDAAPRSMPRHLPDATSYPYGTYPTRAKPGEVECRDLHEVTIWRGGPATHFRCERAKGHPGEHWGRDSAGTGEATWPWPPVEPDHVAGS